MLIGKLLFEIGHEAKKVLQTKDTSISIAQAVLRKYSFLLMAFGMIIICTIVSYIAFYLYINIVY